MKTAGLFLSPLRRAKSRRDSTLLTAGEAQRNLRQQQLSPRAKSRRDGTLLTVCFSLRETLLLALTFFFCANLYAQVTIGGTENPKAGAILDLNSSVRGGLALSNVVILDPELIPQGTNVFEGVGNRDVNPDLCGAMVYNTGEGTTVPAGIYIWNGNCWTKDGGIIAVNMPSITVNGTVTNSYAIVENSTVTFAVVSPQPDISYVWYKSGSPSTLAGTGNTYTTPTLSPETYYYYCKATSNSCPSSNVISGTVELAVFPNSPNPLTIGTGTFTGRTCFDVALTEGNGRGTLAVRRDEPLTATSALADFTQTVTNTQTYTFKPSGTVSKLRFYALEPATQSGQVIQSLSYNPDLKMQLNISGTQTFTVIYKDDLNNKTVGKNNAEALKVDIYAVYNDNSAGTGTDKTVKLTASIKDCSCCGAYTDEDHTQWLSFMCYNLGATHNGNPFTPAAAIHGAKYKGGMKGYGPSNLPALTQAEDQNSAYDSGVTNPDWGSRGTPPEGDWNMSTSNPCPAGWKVPSLTEWTKVTNSSNNTLTFPGNWSAGSYTSGLKIGDALLLPAAGDREHLTGTLRLRGTNGYYWSSANYASTNYMTFNGSYVRTYPYSWYVGCSVRCVTAE